MPFLGDVTSSYLVKDAHFGRACLENLVIEVVEGSCRI